MWKYIFNLYRTLYCFTPLKAVAGLRRHGWRNVFHIVMAATASGHGPMVCDRHARARFHCSVRVRVRVPTMITKNRPHTISTARKGHPPGFAKPHPIRRAHRFSLLRIECLCVCVKGNRACGNFAPECAQAIGGIVVVAAAAVSSVRRARM